VNSVKAADDSGSYPIPRVPRKDVRVQGLLVGGFVLMIVLLGADGFIGFKSILSIREKVSRLTESQFRSVVLIDEVQRVQSALGSVLHRLSEGEAIKDREELEKGVDSIEQSFRDLFASIPKDDPDLQLWRAVEAASAEATQEADRALERATRGRPDVGPLVTARERLLASTNALIHANHDHAQATRRQIDDVASQRLADDAALLTGCLIIACLCAWLVLSTATKLQRQITEHATELGKVSWQLMERQENLARRLSHELHDELGQSLTALKTNFSRFTSGGAVDGKWIEDCSGLLKESIRSTHEIAQLLRPTMLDDFGLDSALRWLCERFEERNRIAVIYQSDLEERLDPQTETHVFRIAQEALTNIARHASANRVEMSLNREADHIRFRIQDNGVGMRPDPDRSRPHFGVTGMKARARSLEGIMQIRSAAGEGTALEVIFPFKALTHEEEDTHLVG
jgi:signal transduction histidine kinase